MGYSAVALPAMQKTDEHPHVSEEEASWIASLSAIASPVGCLLSGGLLDWLGRRCTLVAINVPSVLGWLLIATTPHTEPWFLYQLYAGRFLTGIALGMASSPATVYVSEVVDKSLRGMVVTWPSIGISLGIPLVYVLGYIIPDNWRLVAGIIICFPLASTIASWFLLPESPTWLMSRGRVVEANAAMRRIRGIPLRSSRQKNLEQDVETMITPEVRQDTSSGWKSTLIFFKRPEAYKPLLIMNAFFFFQQFSGIFVIIFYAVTIAKEAGVNFDSYLAAVLIGVCRLIMTVVISFASRRYGRRVLCNTSGVCMTVSIVGLSLYLNLTHDRILTDATYGWWPIMALMMYILSSTAGFLTLPWAMIGEVFPVRIRGPASGVTTCMAYVFSFVILKMYPEMKHLLGTHGLFTFYSTVALAGTICMYVYLPETQGRTLQQIEEHFRGKA
jgi:sugar porter (SP) family MFS transporter